MGEQELLALSSLNNQLYSSLAAFTVEGKIGKGMFSVVYKAKCKSNGATVALKKVQIFEMTDAKARLDCMKEINLLQVRVAIIQG